MFARFRDPSELPPGEAAAFVDPSFGFEDVPVLDCTSFRNCSLFIADQGLAGDRKHVWGLSIF